MYHMSSSSGTSNTPSAQHIQLALANVRASDLRLQAERATLHSTQSIAPLFTIVRCKR